MVFLLSIPTMSSSQTQSGPRDNSGTSVLRLGLDLASDTLPEQIELRDRAIEVLVAEMLQAEFERQLGRNLLRLPADDNYGALVAAQGERPSDHLTAAARSYARFKGAERAGRRDWMSQHMTAARQYAALAARGLTAQVRKNEDALAQLKAAPFAVRRTPEQAALFRDRIRSQGLSPEFRTLLRESGLDADEANAYETNVLDRQADKLGVSMEELYRVVVGVRTALARSLDHFAGIGVTRFGPMSQTFVVGNPRDREETIDLFIRRASVPPEWKLSIVDAEPASDGKPQKRVQEVEAGGHYRVQLPGNGRTTVASVVVPVGIVAENTTARWAVEGKIRDELIGGMVHEMHVPGFMPDLKLPPITPAAVTPKAVSPAAAAQPRWVMPVAIAAGSVFAVAVLAFVLSRLRRRA